MDAVAEYRVAARALENMVTATDAHEPKQESFW
jgi:hypothetical protein